LVHWKHDFLDFTVTRFAKLLVRQMTIKLVSKYRWMDPSNDWGQDGG